MNSKQNKGGKIVLKRVFLIILILIMICGCSHTKSEPVTNEKVSDVVIKEEENKKPEGTIGQIIKIDAHTYQNKKYGYSFAIPIKWDTKYQIVENDHKTSFIYTECPNLNAVMLTIVAWTKDEFKKAKIEDPTINDDDILGKTDKYYFYLITPIDVPFENEEQANKYGEEYHQISISAPEMKERFNLKNVLR